MKEPWQGVDSWDGDEETNARVMRAQAAENQRRIQERAEPPQVVGFGPGTQDSTEGEEQE